VMRNIYDSLTPEERLNPFPALHLFR